MDKIFVLVDKTGKKLVYSMKLNDTCMEYIDYSMKMRTINQNISLKGTNSDILSINVTNILEYHLKSNAIASI